ncbi:helix-turn-helix domain-containing protein [Methyloceanibacter caenitepidi]|uniref:helix-turn-helix domain-containing protein n=1 Tax=Methyloceanibacter caenitepidi TaxID=1384459 RepID=UPI0009E4A1C0
MRLLTPSEAAARLNVSRKTLDAHVKAGELLFINVGRGSNKPRRRFTESDLADFIEARREREIPCRSTDRKARRSTTTTSKCEVVAFTALQGARADGKQKR